MHEFSVTTSIIEILEKIIKEKNIKKVLKVNFLLNPYGGIEPESIKFYYDFLTKDNDVLKDAKLIFKKNKIIINCNDCNSFFESSKIITKCKKCGSANLSVSLPDDIKIKSIDV
jgi:hydrogenase nickel incorporation protein HypA/HybF